MIPGYINWHDFQHWARMNSVVWNQVTRTANEQNLTEVQTLRLLCMQLALSHHQATEALFKELSEKLPRLMPEQPRHRIEDSDLSDR